MSSKPKIHRYKALPRLVDRLRDDLNTNDFVLLYAHNGTGKTRMSMEFKNKWKKNKKGKRDTLYFNAFTEDLFYWDNDLQNDTTRVLRVNPESSFLNGFKELALDTRIESYLDRYTDFKFDINYERELISSIAFKKDRESNIKISRGEENIFIWCIFLSICELTLDGDEAYDWVKYFYIDDPISSLDDNNAIAVASDLSQLLKRTEGKVKTVISSHHSLFFNVMCNELKKRTHARYFMHKNTAQGYILQKTNDTPFFHHVALLSELQQIAESGKINTYHFNTLRSILEKTSSFFGFNDFSACVHGLEDGLLYERALNLLSHGKYSLYEPVEMGDDNKALFKSILSAFLQKYQFELPVLLAKEKAPSTQP